LDSLNAVTTHPALHDAPTERAPFSYRTPTAPRRSGAAAFVIALLLLAAISAYLVAIIAVRLDQVFLPGNEIALPQAFKAVPGLSGAASTGDAAALPSGRINILVLGLDRRPSEGKEPTRSDSMFVLTLDPVTKSGGVLSIPRDLWVEIPDGHGGYTDDRINTAYRYGGLNGYPGGPMRAAEDAIEHNFPQIHIDYTAVIDFSSFIKIIDSLGGIDIQVTEGFRYLEPVSVDDRNGVIPVFKPGLDHMSGERALYYSRFRDGPDGDLGRIRRQQQVMLAVANKLISGGALSHAPELWSRYKDAIDTDIPAYRIPGLALLAKQVGLDRITMRSLGEVTRPAVTAGGADVLLADPADVARVVNELFFDPRLRQEAATVEVQNATARAGLARATADDLVQRGLPAALVTVSQTAPAGQGETVVLNYGGKDYTAERIAEWLGLPRSRVRALAGAAPAGGPDIVVVLGPDAPTPPSGQTMTPPR
jgi:LCP family protein required for cell wall assembly